jgi:hypothetical protein
MTYTLTSHGETLGRTGAELAGLVTGARGWHFIPAPGFDAHRSLLLELQEVTMGLEELMPTPETLAAVREEERDLFVRKALLSDPRAPRFLELMDAMERLELRLHDDTGAVVPTRTLGVTQLELGPREFGELLRSLDPGSDPALSAAPPFYLLVAGMM